MKIETYDKEGQRVIVNYSKAVLAPKEEKPEIIITDYPTYRKCVIESNNQDEYPKDSRDTRYTKALEELIRRDRNLYMSFFKKLREEYNRK